MATKQELAEEATVTKLKQLASDNDVDLGDATTKQDIADKIAATSKVSKEDLDSVVNEGSSGDEGGGEATAEQTAGLTNPYDYAKERSGGRTSDPASRKEGKNVSDVEPDITAGEKSSDALDYNFPPGGDVDRALLSDKKRKGESLPPIEVDSIVTLGKDSSVPDELVGAKATIVTKVEDDDGTEQFTVRTRDEHNATVYCDRNAFAEVHPGGVGIRGFGV